MKIKNLNIIDFSFIGIAVLIKILGLYFFIDGWLIKSEAKRRQFNEAKNLSQQAYFQDNQILGTNHMIIGILIIISSLILISIYLKYYKNK
ncbi:MAG: hypothetical protein ACJ0J5_05760 [Dehalococcoidia bacterium]|nr:hypothetical protein [Chloroflexota bacterium]RZP13770.1 MAG: hypothetical protein EVA32_03730 [Chloroflexota bacterium]|tara:strand:+ start:387 stop:659 length:273 start_codon:yes stop_codon:yes gene_type:complete